VDQGLEGRGWRRKGGAIENLELWQKLEQAAQAHDVEWGWVRATTTIQERVRRFPRDPGGRASGALQRPRSSGFDTWLDSNAPAQVRRYDPDKELHERP